MLKSLQIGRGIAALSVAAFHLSNGFEPGESILADLCRHGHAGVDFFFVLSGFIIFHVHGQDVGKPGRLHRYLRNRFVRVYPTYWLYTVVFVCAVLAFDGSTVLPTTRLGWASTISLIRLSEEPTPISVAWTLFYEIGFYLAFAALIASRRVGMVLMGIWVVAILGHYQVSPRTRPEGVWTSLLCINFFIGMGACWLHQRLSPTAAAIPLAAGAVGLTITALQVDRGMSQNEFTLAVGLCCGLIILGVTTLERTHSFSFGPLVALGNASYTFYLAHQHIQGAIKDGLAQLGIADDLPVDVSFVGILILGAFVAYAIHRLIEVPLIARLRLISTSNRPAVTDLPCA
ncbi:MAG: acyltransferase [Pseudomonadota bacterium]|uniref:acyltransferase family protein n=1 Tax=Phenylobacterium sp. TaxID=1871053 RepID=UPI0025FAE61C|nr:acyltransferase [Phenylobacterium sp.]MBT9471357.1 acyltransferase [Phenylobacterium sp.]